MRKRTFGHYPLVTFRFFFWGPPPGGKKKTFPWASRYLHGEATMVFRQFDMLYVAAPRQKMSFLGFIPYKEKIGSQIH